MFNVSFSVDGYNMNEIIFQQVEDNMNEEYFNKQKYVLEVNDLDKKNNICK